MANVRVHAVSWNMDNVRIEKLIETVHNILLIQLAQLLIGVNMMMKVILVFRLSNNNVNPLKIKLNVKIIDVHGMIFKDAS